MHIPHEHARTEMSKAERLLSYSLLSLITAKPSSSVPAVGAVEEEENASPQLQGLLNNDGAWCWRDDCQGKQPTCRDPQTVDMMGRLSQAHKGGSENFRDVAGCSRPVR